jgi:hypothetical protein
MPMWAETGSWENRVTYLPTGEAVRPKEVLVPPDEVGDAAGVLHADPTDHTSDDEWGKFAVDDVVEALIALRNAGIDAQPNHVLFSHSRVWAAGVRGAPVHANRGYADSETASVAGLDECCGCSYCPPHPAGGPVYADPVHANPVHANPVHANPVHANYRLTGHVRSTVTPAPSKGELIGEGGGPVVVVLDTGWAASDAPSTAFQPPPEHINNGDHPSEDADPFLDPAAGHGTFISGVIRQVELSAQIVCQRVLTTFGDGDEFEIGKALDNLHVALREVDLSPQIVNLSFGGYAFDDRMAFLAQAVRRIQRRNVVVVASAGNDATCRPTFPACLPGVVGVAALDGDGNAARFTNYGYWVRASTLGVDIESVFFEWNGPDAAPAGGGDDPDDFSSQWAKWSGTSFSGPRVAGLIARQMAQTGSDAPAAADAVLASGTVTALLGVKLTS